MGAVAWVAPGDTLHEVWRGPPPPTASTPGRGGGGAGLTCPNPKCSSTAVDVLESRLLSNGTRRRRYACLACRYRWTFWDGPRPKPGFRSKPRGPRRQRPPLTSDEVRLVLTSPLGPTVLATQLDCCRQTIDDIRTGKRRSNEWPELPRRLRQPMPKPDGPSCDQCQHWAGTVCEFDLPDPLEEGPGFAADCSLFDPRR